MKSISTKNINISNEGNLNILENQYICIDCNMIFDEKVEKCNVCDSDDIVLSHELNY